MAAQGRDVGRVIFAQDANGNAEWIVLTLASHVENVAHLVEMWDAGRAYLTTGSLDLEATRNQLIQAARIHDSAKPMRFRLHYREDSHRPGAWQWEYSFAGHRFEVFADNPYVQELARLHHEYSVEGITRAVAELRAKGVEHAENLPLDLYTLEMCDQIEATVALSALGGEPEARVFMDFHIEKLDSSRFGIDPFPFNQNPVQLTIEYARLCPPSEQTKQAETGNDAQRHQAEQALSKWLVEKLREEQELKTVEVSLCPLVAV
ncbi:MAG: hypothetical protein ACP5OO_12855 [Chloroflexia bacterium]